MRVEGMTLSGRSARGMALPLVLVLLAGLWILCLSLLSLTTVGGRSGHVRMEQLQAEMALQAGLQDVKHRLLDACSRDDFLVVQEHGLGLKDPARLFLVVPGLEGEQIRYRFQPLFSSLEGPMEKGRLEAPSFEGGQPSAQWSTQPWLNPVEVDWLALSNEEGQKVGRYAFWVEDLEARLDPRFEVEGMSLQAADASEGDLQWQRLMQGRHLLVSPESSLVAAGLSAPLERMDGRLKNPWADFLERNAIVGLRSYEEQALVPYVEGVSPLVMGRPKRNLNALLAGDAAHAVEDMAMWMRMGLPEFEKRGGGFTENYLETLAANALDYADGDDGPRISPGRYRGIDGQPFVSEVVLHLHFQGLVREDDRWVLKWTFRLFAELWNMSSQPIEGGQARLSYEVNLRPTAVGLSGSTLSFDAPALLEDPNQSSHSLERQGSVYVTPMVEVNLKPDEYRFYEFARVDYRIDCDPQLDAAGNPLVEWFDLVELEHEARGLSLIWNGREVERLARIHRDPHGLANFRTDRRRKTAKACISGLNYGGYGAMINNPGDPRIAHYLRGLPIGENAYPENLSPHRRNIRRRNIYDKDPTAQKTRHYGRVMPSQWPDGGHDSITGDFRVTTSDARFPTDPDWWPHEAVPTPQPSHAPQRLSNRGSFMRVAELGHVFDPLMWTPAYPDLEGVPGSGSHDSDELNGRLSIWQRPAMPLRRGRWPEVSWASLPSQVHGGGNTLRIGRPEHTRFDYPGMRASHLLDLFHCGHPDADQEAKRSGPTIGVSGRVNLNTASREVLRCLVHDHLAEEDTVARVVDPAHDTRHAFGPQLERWQPDDEDLALQADAIADAIIRARPFVSVSELAHLRDASGRAVFGNAALLSRKVNLQWSDAAAEARFANLLQHGGVRSRNFRIWLVGQCLSPSGKITAQSKQVVTVFVDPGQRGKMGEILPEKQKVKVLHVRDF